MRPKESKFLKFLGHRITGFDFRVKNEIPEDEEFEMQMDAGINYELYDKENNIHELRLKVDVTSGNGFITCCCEAKAGFGLPPKATKADIKKMMTVNAPAILFPYVRAAVSTMSALSGYGPITLPAVNFTVQNKKKSGNKHGDKM